MTVTNACRNGTMTTWMTSATAKTAAIMIMNELLRTMLSTSLSGDWDEIGEIADMAKFITNETACCAAPAASENTSR